MSAMTWPEHQEWERAWWDSCTNTFAEESKQISYAYRMGLVVVPDPSGNERWPMYDLAGRSVLDIGGGPCSLLLKTFNGAARDVSDPCDYPAWVSERYEEAGIRYDRRRGEDIMAGGYDEVWIYNCLQHVEDPAEVVRHARVVAPVLRVFEWIDVGVCPGHPHNLTADKLDEWYGGRGTVEQMTGENACYGKAYYGVFQGSPDSSSSPDSDGTIPMP